MGGVSDVSTMSLLVHQVENNYDIKFNLLLVALALLPHRVAVLHTENTLQ